MRDHAESFEAERSRPIVNGIQVFEYLSAPATYCPHIGGSMHELHPSTMDFEGHLLHKATEMLACQDINADLFCDRAVASSDVKRERPCPKGKCRQVPPAPGTKT